MVNPKPLTNQPQSDLVWGAAEIGAITNQTPGEVYYHFAEGRYAGAVWKFSPRKLVGSRRKLRELGFAPHAADAA
jgi:hypothetical protein